MNTIQPAEHFAIMINGTDGKLLAALRDDGTLKLGENYHPDEAARVFWEALAKYMPAMIKAQPKAALDAVDAARYRWLRDTCAYEAWYVYVITPPAAMDDAIDRGMTRADNPGAL